jgi:hypothetical protein
VAATGEFSPRALDGLVRTAIFYLNEVEDAGAMLKALTVADALAIAAAALRRSRDERAMVDYLGIGRRRGRTPDTLAAFPLLKPTAVDLAAFESDERHQLHDALANLTIEARRELIALVWFAQSPSLSFETALRRTRRIPDAAQLGYLMGRRLERSVPAGLEKLGYRRSA